LAKTGFRFYGIYNSIFAPFLELAIPKIHSLWRESAIAGRDIDPCVVAGIGNFFPLEGMETDYLNLVKDADLCVIKTEQYSHHSLFSPGQLISHGLMQSQASLYWQ